MLCGQSPKRVFSYNIYLESLDVSRIMKWSKNAKTTPVLFHPWWQTTRNSLKATFGMGGIDCWLVWWRIRRSPLQPILIRRHRGMAGDSYSTLTDWAIISTNLFHLFMAQKEGGGELYFSIYLRKSSEKSNFSVQVYRKRIKSFEISASNLKASRHTPFFLYFLLFLCKLLREVLIDQKLACHESICLIPFSHSSWSVCCVCVRGKSLGPNIMTSILPQSVSYPGSISSSLPSRVSPRLLHSQLCIALSICT
jgi:hypothetical protein